MTWHQVRDRVWITTDPDEVAEVVKALAEDRLYCGCSAQNIVAHCTTYVTSDGQARTYQCRSFSRWFDPRSRKMEGRAHCTCDYCF